MFLNTHPHFMAARGYKRYSNALKQLVTAIEPMPVKPLRFIITRTTATNDPANPRIDYVPVAVLTPDNYSWATHLGTHNIYCTNA